MRRLPSLSPTGLDNLALEEVELAFQTRDQLYDEFALYLSGQVNGNMKLLI